MVYAILSQDLYLDVEGRELVILEGSVVLLYEEQVGYNEQYDVHFALSGFEYTFIQ